MSDGPAMSAGRSQVGGPALRRCVAGDPARFAAEYWGRAPLLSRAPDLPASYDDLLTLDAVDELLSRRGLRTPFLRIAKDGVVASDNQFTGGGGAGAEIGDQVRDDKVAALFTSGHTVVLQGLHRTWPPLIDFAYDVHDVFVLQVAGEKRWTIHAPVHEDPLRNEPWQQRAEEVAAAARDNPPVIDAVLRPGDALYVPRGFLHSAKALGGVSAHLTVGLHTLTRYHLVEDLVAMAADRAGLRAPLPFGIDPADPEQLAEHLDAVRAALADQLAAATAEDVARRLRRRTWTGNRPEPLGPLAQSAALRDLSCVDVVRWRTGLRYRLTNAGAGKVRLELPDRSLLLPKATEAALRRLASGDEVTVGELPGLDDGDRLVLVRRLLTEAAVVAAKA